MMSNRMQVTPKYMQIEQMQIRNKYKVEKHIMTAVNICLTAVKNTKKELNHSFLKIGIWYFACNLDIAIIQLFFKLETWNLS